MIKAICIAATLAIASVTGAQAAEVGVRHSTGGSHTNTYGGRTTSEYSGSIQRGHTYDGSTSTVERTEGSTNVSGNASGGFGVGFGTPDKGDGRGASCERGRASFCDAALTSSTVDRAETSYQGYEYGEEAYSGTSRNRFNGSAWSNFSETSTFAR
jgi:hypothetical protein